MKSSEAASSERMSILAQGLHWLDDHAEALRDACRSRRILLLSVVSSVYFVTTGILASRKPMWNDELFTYFIAQAPTLSDVWSALLTGADQNPFSFYVLTRWSLALFGVHEWALRLPEMIGVWVAGLCLFSVVTRRTEALYGFVAMTFLFVTGANFYSIEARPYGLVLAFTASAWLCWQIAAEGRSRPWSLLGLWASLCAAVGCHYYAVLVFAPLGVGELVRALNRKRNDWALWMAILSGLLPLLCFWPLIQRARTYANGFWAVPSWKSVPDAYSTLLMPAPLMTTLVFLFAGLVMLQRPQGLLIRADKMLPSIPNHELAAAITLTALPGISVAATMLTTGAFTARYALPTVLGVSVLIALTVARIHSGRALLGAVTLVLASAGFLMLSARSFPHTTESSVGRVYPLLRIEKAEGMPIVVSDPHNFMMLAHYAQPDLSSRLVYLADPQSSLHYLGHSTIDRGMLDLSPWFHMNVQEAGRFLSEQFRFLLYVHGGYLGGPLGNGLVTPGLNWLLSDLNDKGWNLELKVSRENHLVFLVTKDGEYSSARAGMQP